MQRNILILIFVLLLTACSPRTQPVAAPSETAGPDRELVPYSTPIPSLASELAITATKPPLPSATPTPMTYTVKQGDDLLGIALSHGVTLEALLAANPTVDPYVLGVGSLLVIPPEAAEDGTADIIANPTPMPVTLQNVHCYPQKDGGAWCFLVAYNGTDFAVESISARVSLEGENGIVSHLALTPLNLLPMNTSQPLIVYFPPPLVQPLQAGVELSSALPVPEDDARYLMTHIENLVVNVASDGLSAELTGDVVLDSTGGSASVVWVGGAAYSEQGNVIGVRRWESPASFNSTERLSFDFRVYSVSGKIESALAFAEARR
jgi:LysM repeat protein